MKGDYRGHRGRKKPVGFARGFAAIHDNRSFSPLPRSTPRINRRYVFSKKNQKKTKKSKWLNYSASKCCQDIRGATQDVRFKKIRKKSPCFEDDLGPIGKGEEDAFLLWLNNLKKRGRTGNGIWLGLTLCKKITRERIGRGGKSEEYRFIMDLETRFQFGGFSRIAQGKWHSG